MIKVKDGYGKLIGTTYKGSATQVLLSNGGNLEFSSETKANTLVQRNASQHIYATYFNSAISDEALTDIGSVYVRNTSDTFIRRISKTQFYSIIDNKFVTLDTAQTITGVKTFSTGPILAINATITQNQNSTSNYTTVIKWLKGGTSQGTYNPSIGQHNTGGDGTGSICILPYPTETSPWNGTVGLFISKGVLRLDGKAVAIADNYYTKTESDNRYVNVTGDTMTGPLIVKASITGTQLISNIANGTAPLKVTSKTVVTNLNSDLLDGHHETSFFRARGSQTIAGSIPTTTELSSNNNLSGNWNVSFPGASGHLVQFNTGSGSTRYMQFYSHYSGSLYWRNSTDSTLSTKSWKTIVDSANYTGIVLKIGTATKGSATLPIYLNAGTPTACSTTLGVSITGNAATATKLQTARTINGTSFNGTTNITTAYWGATRTITLSGAVTGSASVNGSQNVTITTTYQTGSIDGRYVGGKKAAGHGSQGTAYTADTYSSNFVNKAFVAYAERGSWAYANNGYITTNTGVNIPLAGTAIFQWGASDTNKTQLFITPHNNSGVSNPATNEMLFYTSNGSGYISAWTRVLTHRNYTTYTVTKTGGGASGTWGISITGNANTATKLNSRGRLTALSGTNAGETGLSMYEAYSNGYPSTYGNLIHLGGSTAAGRGELLLGWAGSNGGYASVYYRNKRDTSTANWSSWVTLLDSSNYTSFTNANYVQSLSTSGNYVTWTKNNTVNNLTVPYATASIRVNSSSSVQNTGLTYYSSSSFVVGGTAAGGQWGMPSDSQDASYKNGQCLRMYWGSTYYTDILSGPNSMGTTHGLYLRQIVNGSVATGTFPGGWRLLLDSYNYQRYGDTRYVTLTTNQTVSGIKTFSRQQKFTVATGTSPFTVSSTTVVSNLNADLLDGYHAASFYQYGYVMFAKTIDASGLSTSTYYPVTFSIGSHSNVRIECRVSLNSGTKPSWSTHASGFSVRKIWEVNGSGYGTNPVNRRILVSDYAYTSVDPVRGVGQLTNSSVEYVYVRGGGKYFFYVSHNISPILRTSTYTTNSQSVSPTTSAPAAISTPTLTFQAGRFSASTYKPLTGINTVNIPTNTSHLTNDSGFLTGNVIRAVSANGYWGMADPSSNTGVWIRTTNQGIIPYQSGGAGNGHQSLGTSSWYFRAAYIDNIYGTASNADKLDGYHASSFLRNFSAGNVNFNTLTTSGVYRLFNTTTNGASNGPTGADYSQMLVMHGGGDTIAQMAISYSSRKVYVRAGNPSNVGGSGSWSSWYTLAFTTDIPTVTNYYWANIKVSASSSTSTSPTFNAATVTKLNVKGTANSNAYISSDTVYNMYAKVNDLVMFVLDGSQKAIRSSSAIPSTISLGTSSVRWSNLYSVAGNFSGSVTISGALNIGSTFRQLYSGSAQGAAIHKILNYSPSPFGLLTRIYSNGNVSLQVQREANDSECFNLLLNHAGGNVGIGTTSPTAKLHVVDGIKVTGGVDSRSMEMTNGSIRFNAYSGGWASGFTYYNTSNSLIGYSCGAYGGGNALTYYFYGGTYSSPKMIINPSGNVGIGVTTASYKLHVSGSIYSTSGFVKSGSSNSYVLLGGGGHKALTDFAKGNAGASNRGVYVTSGTVKAMTYYLNATINSGSSGKLAYYSGTNSIDDYTSTKGSSSTPIYLNAGVPTACSGVIVKYWGWYNISCYSSTTPSYSKKGGNFNFVTSVSRRSEGKYTVGTVYPSGYTYNNTIYWGSGRLNKAMASNSSNSLLYVTMFNGYQSGSTYYLYVNTADDSSANDGSFDVFFLCF